MNREWHVEIRSSGNKLYGGYLTGEPESVLFTALKDVQEKWLRDGNPDGECVTWIGISESRRK